MRNCGNVHQGRTKKIWEKPDIGLSQIGCVIRSRRTTNLFLLSYGFFNNLFSWSFFSRSLFGWSFLSRSFFGWGFLFNWHQYSPLSIRNSGKM